MYSLSGTHLVLSRIFQEMANLYQINFFENLIIKKYGRLHGSDIFNILFGLKSSQDDVEC